MTLLALRAENTLRAFLYGFIVSFIVNAGGFYWMVYTIHEFGHLPWSLSALIFLLFCGFGALNLPLFAAGVHALHRRLPLERLSPRLRALWFTLGLPAFFILLEYTVPKLFPFYAGQSLYWLPVLTQISEWTGALFLSFAAFSVGSGLTLGWLSRRHGLSADILGGVIPGLLVLVWVGFGVWRLSAPAPQGKPLRVALIQANIGSLEKVAARKGLHGKLRYTLDRYRALTEQALAQGPDLILWPETAMPFELSSSITYAEQVRSLVRGWKVPLITGAYAPHETDPSREYNAAYLLSPEKGDLRVEIYRKNVLLAFGEFFPGGDWFPKLYEWFPQVSNFARGTAPGVFTLADGTRLGVTVCYEAIIPSFYRRTVAQEVRAVVNLTNDSWFGPTSEPYHHGALAVFRSVETRLPLLRVTNTGISFVVDTWGRMSRPTGVYQEGIAVEDVLIPEKTPSTLYQRWGDWWVALSLLALVLLVGAMQSHSRRNHVALSV